MTCNPSDLTAITVTNVRPTQLYGRPSGIRRLFVSDNPETIVPSHFTNGYATLWDDAASGKSSVSYRLFFWHLNSTGANMKYGLTVSNESCGRNADTYTVQNLKMTVSVISDFPSLGRAAAKALLGELLECTTPVDCAIHAGCKGVIKEWNVPNNQLVGGVLEFDLVNSTSTREMVYKLRSAAADCSSCDLRCNENPVVPLSSPHPRGTWEFADIQGYTDAALTQPIHYTLGTESVNFSISNNVNDNIMTAAASYNKDNAKTNAGHYGVIYSADVRLTNSSSSSLTARIWLNARGGTYAGAVKYNGTTYGVPSITAFAGAVKVADVTVAPNSTITVPVQVTHAGGYSLPVAVLLQTL